MMSDYAQIASYLQSSRDQHSNHNDKYASDQLPSYLRPSITPLDTWGLRREKSGLSGDFIMVAEFSELEGPKPVMTIPKDVGTGFDQNTFSVKILAVDHQHSSEGFTITEDAQVVYSDHEMGVYAFVHHLVLFDNTARGFVRPYCIAYITAQQRKVMQFYEEISWQLKKAARYFKYGNRLVFVNDLERHIKDLEHTKAFFLNQVSKMRLKDSVNGEDNNETRRNAEAELYKGLQTIRQSNLEIKEILSILKPLLSDRKLEARFRLLEEKAFHGNNTGGCDNLSLQENWYNDLSSLNNLDTRCGSLTEPRISPLTLFKPKDYKPHLVETKKAKRFNCALRGLHELCSWGAKEGIKKLRCIHESLSRDMMILLLDSHEAQMKYPSFSAVCHADCLTGNLLSCTYMAGASRQFSTNFDDDQDSLRKGLYGSVGSMTSFDSLESFKSADSRSLSLAMMDGSPCSAHTYDSHMHNKFESAQSSPKITDEISLLNENEYYSDSCSSNDQLVDNTFDLMVGGTHQQEETLSVPDLQQITRTTDNLFDKNKRSNPCGWETPEGSHYGSPPETVHSESTLDSSESKCIDIDSQVRTADGIVKDRNSPDNNTISSLYPKSNALSVKGRTEIANSKTLIDSDVPVNDDNEEPGKLLHGMISRKSSNTQTNKDGSRHGSLLSTLISETDATETECLGRWQSDTDTLRASPFRPVTPFPVKKRGTIDQAGLESSLEDSSNYGENGDDSSNRNRSSSDENTIKLTHHLVSLGNMKVGSDSGGSSVLSAQDLHPHRARNVSFNRENCFYNTDVSEDPNDDYVNISSEVSSPWKPKCGLASVGEWINNIGHGRPGYSILDMLSGYHNLQHVIASLLMGRPVLVCGSPRCEAEINFVVNGLSVFVGAVTRKRQHAVLEWTLKPPRVTDLTRLKLVGVCRPERRSIESFISTAVRQTCTIMDVEKKTITAPPYQGQLITSLLAKKKVFKTDAQILSYIQWWLTDLLGKAFIFYHSFCLNSSGSVIYSQSVKDHQASYCKAVSKVMGKNNVKDSDCDILENIMELVKQSQLTHTDQSSGTAPTPLRLHHKTCQIFKC